MILLALLVTFSEPKERADPEPPKWTPDDAIAVADRIARVLPNRALTVKPPDNRSSEHLDLQPLTDALVARTKRSANLTLATTIYLLAAPRRFLVLAELTSSTEKIWLYETSVAKPARETASLPRWNDDDAREAATQLFAACLSEGWLADEAPRPSLAVEPVQNRTDEHAPTALFRFALERAVLADGRFRLVLAEPAFTLRTTLEVSSQWNATEKRTYYRARLQAIRTSDAHVSCVHTTTLTKAR